MIIKLSPVVDVISSRYRDIAPALYLTEHRQAGQIISIQIHRRWMETESKAKVVASVWEADSLPSEMFYLGRFGRKG